MKRSLLIAGAVAAAFVLLAGATLDHLWIAAGVFFIAFGTVCFLEG